MSNFDAVARDMLAAALEAAALANGVDSLAVVLERLGKGDLCAGSVFQHSLAARVAECLGNLDDGVRAVYHYGSDSGGGASPDAGFQPVAPTHLVVWTRRKTAAFQSLLKALNRALAQSYADLVTGASPLQLLDIHVIDDVDVENRSGYAALLFPPRFGAGQVWKRDTAEVDRAQ